MKLRDLSEQRKRKPELRYEHYSNRLSSLQNFSLREQESALGCWIPSFMEETPQLLGKHRNDGKVGHCAEFGCPCMQFEWDEQKRRANIRKHGFDFRDARKVFASPMLVAPDDRYDYGQDR